MAIKSFKPGRTSITVGHRLRAATLPRLLTEVPGGLYPMRLLHYELDEYRIMAGWPVPVPGHDIRSPSVISAAGEFVDHRPDPVYIVTNAAVRWVASETFYSETDLTWFPLAGDMTWRTSVDYAPNLITDYEYRVGPERFFHSALNFDSDTTNHMWLDGADTLLPATGYTVIMVMSPNSAYGNNEEVPYNGLWCPGGPTPVPGGGGTFTEEVGANFSVTLQGNYTYLQTEQTARVRGVSVATALNSNAPLYLVLNLDRPMSSLYAASGPSAIRKVSLPTGPESTQLDSGIVLGRSTGDINHTADMALLDLGIYPYVLTDSEIRAEIATLSESYGDGS